ncbi:hypothetical protein [Actinomadura rudentiformis]|uniref:PA domain-containing protein n=1 Tax=Actinomadura rudentiformis TaxID=359158 RepID=A0A6H9Z4N3_9ACTN|nr:hypothetical protein [Actinomadura rudentiformis]KAB2348452.1 hypothetical protein F8566_16850 [Actinomadura rudentiformis]
MRTNWKFLAMAAVVPLAAYTAVAIPGEWKLSSAATQAAGQATHPVTGTITLVTGDRVRVGGDGTVSVQASPGREDVGFQQIGEGLHLRVLPLDAVSPVAQGRVDERLFEVGRLLEAGYGDARTATLPVTVEGPGADDRRAVPKTRAARFWHELPASASVKFTGRSRSADAPPPAEHTLKAVFLDRDGRPAHAFGSLWSLDDPSFGLWWIGPGDELGVPPGRYALVSTIQTAVPGRPDPSYTQIMNPEIRVDGDVTLTLDARQGRRVEVAVERATAQDGAVVMEMSTKAPPGAGFVRNRSVMILPNRVPAYAATTAPSPGFLFALRATRLEPRIQLHKAGDQPFPVDVTYAYPSPEYLGTHTLDAVNDSGTKGTLVILDRTEGDEELAGRISAVASEGGAAVLVVGTTDKPPFFAEAPKIPVLYTYQPEGARLRALAEAGRVRVTTRGIRYSPYQYSLFYPSAGRVPDRPAYRVADRDLGVARVHYRGPGGPAGVTAGSAAVWDGGEFSLVGNEIPLPATRTEYFTASPGVRFRRVFTGEATPLGHIAARSFRPGEHVTETVFKGALGPSFATPPELIKGKIRPAWAYRQGDTLDMAVPLFSGTGPGEYGLTDSGFIRLYRDGHLVGEAEQPQASITAPVEEGSYRLDVEATAGRPEWQATTVVRVSWTFRSAHTKDATPLPLMAVRYTPTLDRLNQAPAGGFSIPVRVEHQAGSAPVTKLTVRASFDDGSHWRAVPLREVGGTWIARVPNPSEGHVSLQAIAKDANGNTVKQTILRAYTIG